MPKFFVNPTNIHDNSINITGEDVIHIKKVLRLKAGDNIIVSDGNHFDYYVSIESIEPNLVRTKVLSSQKNISESSIEIILFQAIPKSDKMDFIIQKSVELGVKKIFPVLTDRTIVKIQNFNDAKNKVSRWQRISLEAAKQCNRGIVPTVEMPVTLKEALTAAGGSDLNIIPYELDSGHHLKPLIRDQGFQKIAVFIGPEGGFTEEEIRLSQEAGIKPITLGPRILRTETAGVAVLSILMYELGDVGG